MSFGRLAPRPQMTRDEEIIHLVKKFKADPELLNEILVYIRKDKIDKIKNR